MLSKFKARESGLDYMSTFGIDLNKLGCAMLRVIPFNHTGKRWEEEGFTPYVSPDPDQFWINGVTDRKETHVTLRYGFMPVVTIEDAEVIRQKYIGVPFSEDYYLSGTHSYLLRGTYSYFPGFNGEYFVLVFKIDPFYYDLGEYIQDAHNAYGLLPNLATFNPPEFHITLGYFEMVENLEDCFSGHPVDIRVKVGDIYYGKHMRP